MNTTQAERYLATYLISSDEEVENSQNVMHPVACLMTEFLEQETETFEQCTKIMMKFLAKNKNPHCTAIITITGAELLEGSKSLETDEFLKD